MIVSTLSDGELQLQAETSNHPKWMSICLLRSKGLPTLNAAFVPVSSSATQVHFIAHEFAQLLDMNHIMVRSDGGIESKSYYRGGKTLPIALAIEEAMHLIAQGRVVIFVEPTNSYQNRFSINVIINQSGDWAGEALGLGYDTSDLQRGFVAPKWVVSGPRFEPNAFEKFALINVNISENKLQTDQQRWRDRIRSIADLIGCKEESELTQEKLVREFLEEQNSGHIFEGEQVLDTRATLRTVNDCQILFGALTNRHELFPMTIAAAVLWDRRFVYWDITFGKMKWALNGLTNN